MRLNPRHTKKRVCHALHEDDTLSEANVNLKSQFVIFISMQVSKNEGYESGVYEDDTPRSKCKPQISIRHIHFHARKTNSQAWENSVSTCWRTVGMDGGDRHGMGIPLIKSTRRLLISFRYDRRF
ncbi:hypothetical protein AAG906_016094 [Vitis piasezkii]